MTHSFGAVLSHRDTLTSTVLPACCPEYGPHQPSRSSRTVRSWAPSQPRRAMIRTMAFKLIESAQRRWRAVNVPHLVALVRAGAKFDNGKLIERRDESGGDQQVA